MFVKIPTVIYVEVTDAEQAEEAAHTIDGRAADILNNGFPHGSVIQADVEGATPLTDEEISELGFEE